MFPHPSITSLLPLLLLTLLISFSSALRPLSRRNATCPKCFPGKICVGPRGNKKCVIPMQKGQVCGKDPFCVCKRDLVCENFVCRDKYAPKGGRCTKKGLPCFPGYVCTGMSRGKRCVKPMREGKPRANNLWWVCSIGLVIIGLVWKVVCWMGWTPSSSGSMKKGGSDTEMVLRCEAAAFVRKRAFSKAGEETRGSFAMAA